jgi:hypothetical protein
MFYCLEASRQYQQSVVMATPVLLERIPSKSSSSQQLKRFVIKALAVISYEKW